MRSRKQVVAEMPIVGYLLKVAHDFVKLPIIRRDLHYESLFLRGISEAHEAALRSGEGETAEIRTKISLIEQHFSSILDHMANTAAAVHSLEERTRLMQDQIRTLQEETRTAQDQIRTVQLEVRPLQEHVEAFPATLRRAIRSTEAVTHRVDNLSARLDTMPTAGLIEDVEERLLQRLETLDGVVTQQGAKVTITEQHFSSLLDHMSNAAAAIHSLQEQVSSMQEQVETFPTALREARRSEREVLNGFEQRLALLTNGAANPAGAHPTEIASRS